LSKGRQLYNKICDFFNTFMNYVNENGRTKLQSKSFPVEKLSAAAAANGGDSGVTRDMGPGYAASL